MRMLIAVLNHHCLLSRRFKMLQLRPDVVIADPENSTDFGVSGRTRFGSSGVGSGGRRRSRHGFLRRLDRKPDISGGHGRIRFQCQSFQTGFNPVLTSF